MSRIFTGPNITLATILGLFIMVLGGIVCVFAGKIKAKLTGRPADGQSEIPLKLGGLAIVIIGLLITVYM